MLSITEECFASVHAEARALTAAHWNEVEAPMHGPQNYEPDAARYTQLEALNMLHIMAARSKTGALAGYAAFCMLPCPHRPAATLAVLDGLYLAPAARRGFAALSLLRTAEKSLARRGVDLVQYSSPVSRPCDALYRRLGARCTETLWHKEIR